MKGALQVKLNIEREAEARWLLYSPTPEPEPARDWLLDIRLRAKPFRADSTSILLDDLGLASQTLRGHLKARAKFFRAKERIDRLKRLVVPLDKAEDLDRKMLAVLARADQPEFFAILLRLFGGLVFDEGVDLEALPKAWQDIAANDLTPSFWGLAKREMGYQEAEGSAARHPACCTQQQAVDGHGRLTIDARIGFIADGGF